MKPTPTRSAGQQTSAERRVSTDPQLAGRRSRRPTREERGGEPSASVAICPHLSVEHYRGGEKWVTELANRLVEDGIDVAVRALPYAPGGERRVSVRDVLDERVPYREAWRHDLSGFDTAYVFYNPLSALFFRGARYTIAGIHSWAYVSEDLYEPHYGAVPTVVKALYRLFGARELGGFDAVHSVTPAYDSPHPTTVSIPNFVDTERFRPDRAPLADEFTVLSTAAHIPEKGWDTIRAVAAGLSTNARADAGRPARRNGRRTDTGSLARADGGAAESEHSNASGRLGPNGRGDTDERNDIDGRSDTGGHGSTDGHGSAAVRVVTTGKSDCESITGLGFLDEADLADAYARAHVVLHPARVDTDSMVINEACASGTPVVTTPIATHVRENEAILHGRTVPELCTHVETLRREFRHSNEKRYEARCRRARAEGEAHSIEAIYPRLKRLLTAGPDGTLGPRVDTERAGGGTIGGSERSDSRAEPGGPEGRR